MRASIQRAAARACDEASPGFDRPMHAALERDLSGYDIATSFCSLYYEPPETMARITRALSGTVEYFVVQASVETTHAIAATITTIANAGAVGRGFELGVARPRRACTRSSLAEAKLVLVTLKS